LAWLGVIDRNNHLGGKRRGQYGTGRLDLNNSICEKREGKCCLYIKGVRFA